MVTLGRAHWSVASFIALLLLGVMPVQAKDAESAAERNAAKAQQAIALMSDFLGKTKQFSVTLDIGYDIVQDWGQKIEFGETRIVTVRRPDRLRVDTTDRNGAVSGLVFDGKEIVAFDINEKVYASAAKAGTLDEVITYFVNGLGMRLPLAGILSARFPEAVKEWADDIAYVEEATIAGTRCDHIALSGNWEDVQMWIAQGDQPLLQRMVITYTRAEGQPQFRAQLKDWNLSPSVADSTFAFTPPEAATKISFAPQQAAGLHPGVVDLKEKQP